MPPSRRHAIHVLQFIKVLQTALATKVIQMQAKEQLPLTSCV